MKKKTVNINSDLHQKVKIESAKRNMKVADFVDKAIKEELKKK